MNSKRGTLLAIVAAELFAGVTMLAGYQAWFEPGAPRHHKQPEAAAAATTPAPAPVAVIPAPVAAVEEAPKPSALTPAAAVPPPPAPAVVKPPVVAVKPKPQPKAVAAAQLPLAPATVAPSPAQVRPAPVSPAPAPASVANDVNSITQRGINALNSRDYANAAKLLRQARQMTPRNPDLGYLLGMALEASGEEGAAIDAFKSCTSGPYAQIAKSHVKMLVKKLRK